MSATDRPFADDQVDSAVQQAMVEIEDDIAEGTVPATVRTFAELHDYVDANCYGGLCDDDGPWKFLWDLHWTSDSNDVFDFANAVQDRVNAWLAAGRPQRMDAGA